MMLKRTYFQNKKKAQKLEIDKLQSALMKTVEICLKESNKTDSLATLKSSFSLKLSKDNKEAFAKVAAEVKDYVKFSNEYYKYKGLEEKARVSCNHFNIFQAKKKNNGQTQKKKEESTYQSEMERILNVVGNLVSSERRPRLINKFLMPEFQISSSLHPQVGKLFHKPTVFPDFNFNKPCTVIFGEPSVM